MSTISGTGTLYIREESGSIQYSNDNSTWTTISGWPATVVNTDTSTTLIIIFTTDITISNPNGQNKYFICGSNEIQIGNISLNPDGTRPTIIISGVTDYPGLIQNGTGAPNTSKHNITISNIIVNSSSSTLISGGGWIEQSFSSSLGVFNNTIINCSSNGNIPFSGGGIVGEFIAYSDGNLQIIGCTSSGNIEDNAGGIVGNQAAFDNGIVIIDKCSSSGNIGLDAGGICGPNAASYNGTVTISNCYNIGNTISARGGGICGNSAGLNGHVIISNCYSIGLIDGFGAGGIIGENGYSALITNCYTTGNILSNSGGIVGRFFSADIIVTNCYTSGSGSSGGIYADSSNDNLQGANNYSEANNGNSGSWTTNNANLVLTGIPIPGPIGTSWITVVPNQPYNLRNIGFSPYSINNIITPGLTLNPSFSQTIQAGDSTIVAILPTGYTYTIIGINNQYPITYPLITINVATGQITTAPEITPGLYEIVVRNEINPYSVTIFYLTIPGGGGEPIITNVVITPPCCEIKQCIRDSPTTDTSNELLTTTLTGKTIIGNVDRYYSAIQNGTRTFFAEPIFKSYREYMIYLQSKN
jgi:hypothetical protein